MVVVSWVYLRKLCMYFCTSVLICTVNNNVWVCPSLPILLSTHYFFFSFWITAVVRGVKKYLTEVLICISQIITEGKRLSLHICWPIMCLLFQMSIQPSVARSFSYCCDQMSNKRDLQGSGGRRVHQVLRGVAVRNSMDEEAKMGLEAWADGPGMNKNTRWVSLGKWAS